LNYALASALARASPGRQPSTGLGDRGSPYNLRRKVKKMAGVDDFMGMQYNHPSMHDSRFHHRRSIRLPAYSYAWMGFYFVTLCAHQRQCLLGEILAGRMVLNENGRVVEEEWRRTPLVRPEVRLDTFMVMPNHFHGILQITPAVTPEVVGATRGRPQGVDGRQGPESRSLGAIVAGFKSACTSRINALRGTSGTPLWQRNYFERVIRNEEELLAVRRYIENNPAAWAEDEENPGRS
jgi:putative transposase